MNSYAEKIKVIEPQSVTSILQDNLVDALDISHHAKQAHWNIKGSNFFALHKMFDDIYADVSEHADIIAERITALGGRAIGTIQEVELNTRLPQYSVEIDTQEEHLKAFSQSLNCFGKNIHFASEEVSKLGDEATADLFIEILRSIDKTAWLVDAHNAPKS